MDVDHFDPTIKDNYRQPYENLFLATRHCNGKKQDMWPDAEMRSQGIRFLDCTKEHDYGDHILEDPKTHRVFGITPAGRYHVRILDLNADVFVKNRRMRSELRKVMTSTPMRFVKPITQIQLMLGMMQELLKLMIPEIPYGEPPAILASRSQS
jgi:hypothetical protein